MDDSTPREMPPYEARKYFEVNIAEIAKMYGVNAKDLRDTIKKFLIEHKLIQASTKELTPAQMQAFGNKMHGYHEESMQKPDTEWLGPFKLMEALFL
jgi:hypothetical protein